MRTTRARTSDPETSHAAAEKVTALRASQLRVKNMFVLYGDMHDRQLLTVLNEAEKSAGLKPMSPSGARSRRSELARPNMDRLDEIAVEMGRDRDQAWPTGRAFGDTKAIMGFDSLSETEGYKCPVTGLPLDRATAIRRLRLEGFRSPLWDTGKREIVDGRNVIVWGIAR